MVMGFELKKREATSLDFCCSAGMTGGDVIWPDSGADRKSGICNNQVRTAFVYCM